VLLKVMNKATHPAKRMPAEQVAGLREVCDLGTGRFPALLPLIFLTRLT
jgi:hypothetical protein